MASPWKLLARLVSPRREQKGQDGAADDVKPDVLVSAEPTETAAGEELDSTERLAVGLRQPDDQIDAALEDAEHVLETGSGVQASVAIESAASTETVHVSASEDEDTAAADDGPKSSQTSGSVPGKRSRHGKKAEAIAVVPQASPVVPSHSDDAISLDEEISLLRDQLVAKLQLQNAQLRRMLARFER